MRYTVNYITEEVMNLSTPSDVSIKYPGGKWDLETLQDLVNKGFKIVLHGVIPSSGSILDPKFCDHFDNFSKFVTLTNQQWLSFHFDYKQKYGEPDYIKTLEKNLGIIRKYFPNMLLIMENLPPVDNIESWCANPKLFNEILEKYNLKMLLDVPHAQISAEFFGMSFEDYVNQFDLSKVIEIHFSGLGYTKNGKLYDGHIMANEKDYKCLEYVLPKCPNLKMVSLEFAPSRDYDNETVAKEYRNKYSNQDLYNQQQKQLKNIQKIVEKCKKEDDNQKSLEC